MALTDNAREKKSKRVKKKPMDAVGNFRYSDAQKVEAVSSWLALGNLALTSRLLGIPEITLRVWKTSEWWKNLVEEMRMQEKIVLSARMKSLVEASQTIVAQRLESGDPILNQKTGEIIYKPVSMKDAHKVAVDLIDRKKELDKLTVDDGPTEARDDDKLEKLAERFAEMATKSIENNLNKRRTVDAEIVDAVHDEREAGLQERVRQVPFQARTNQEPDGENDGPEAS
jgi:hypothetical protein